MGILNSPRVRLSRGICVLVTGGSLTTELPTRMTNLDTGEGLGRIVVAMLGGLVRKRDQLSGPQFEAVCDRITASSFCSASTFTSAFRRRYGLRPRDLRTRR